MGTARPPFRKCQKLEASKQWSLLPMSLLPSCASSSLRLGSWPVPTIWRSDVSCLQSGKHCSIRVWKHVHSRYKYISEMNWPQVEEILSRYFRCVHSSLTEVVQVQILHPKSFCVWAKRNMWKTLSPQPLNTIPFGPRMSGQPRSTPSLPLNPTDFKSANVL